MDLMSRLPVNPKPGPHEFTTAGNWDGHHCTICGSAMHCPECSNACGAQGHIMRDADGFFYSCQEYGRAQAWRMSNRQNSTKKS